MFFKCLGVGVFKCLCVSILGFVYVLSECVFVYVVCMYLRFEWIEKVVKGKSKAYLTITSLHLTCSSSVKL